MTTDDAKAYLSKREIPRLFESLMTGLMYHRPTDHITYLIDCLQKVQEKGTTSVSWSAFVDIRRTKTPLPPISPSDGKKRRSRPSSRQKEPSRIEDVNTLDERKASPLPPISKAKPDGFPDVPMVLIMGGPGSGKATQIKLLQDSYPGWIHLSMGSLLKAEVANRTAEERWSMIRDLVNNNELVPEDVTADLIVTHLKKHSNAKGFILEGYPRTVEQVAEFEKLVGHLDMAFMLDCEEKYCIQRLQERGKKENGNVDLIKLERRLTAFKAQTLPAAKLLDDKRKLFVLNGEKDVKEVAYELGECFHNSIFGDKNGKKIVPQQLNTEDPPESSSVPQAASYERPVDALKRVKSELADSMRLVGDAPEIEHKDTGRKEDLPQCPIVILAGGPGSGRGTQAKRIVQHYPGTVHISMGDIIRKEISDKGTADDKWGMVSTLVQQGEMAPEEVTVDLLKEQIAKQKDASAIILEGFPRDKMQVEEFNKHVGGVNFVLLIDCEEYYMQKRLADRGKETDRIDDNLKAISARISFFRNKTLPILKHYDDNGKLVVVYGDRDADEIFFEISQILDRAFFGDKGKEADTQAGEDDKEVVEESMVKEVMSITGGDLANPEYSKQLDAAAEAAQKEEGTANTQESVAEETPQTEETAPESIPQTEQTTPEVAPQTEQTAPKETPQVEQIVPEETPQTEQTPAEETPQTEQTPTEEAPQTEQTPTEETAQTEQTPTDETPQTEQTAPEEVPQTEEKVSEEAPQTEQTAPEGAPQTEQTAPEEPEKTQTTEDIGES